MIDYSFVFPVYSLRVNLDMGKSAYGWMIMKDENIPGTVVRTSTIPEELGRLVYLLTDKTGRCPNILKKDYSRFLVLELKRNHNSLQSDNWYSYKAVHVLLDSRMMVESQLASS